MTRLYLVVTMCASLVHGRASGAGVAVCVALSSSDKASALAMKPAVLVGSFDTSACHVDQSWTNCVNHTDPSSSGAGSMALMLWLDW
jgi:hypothetical protein